MGSGLRALYDLESTFWSFNFIEFKSFRSAWSSLLLFFEAGKIFETLTTEKLFVDSFLVAIPLPYERKP